MSSPAPSLPACPHLPIPPDHMDWRALDAHGEARDEAFYLTALTYGNYLWTRATVARAILCLDRALGADLPPDAAVLKTFPLPYAAMAWFLAGTPADVFTGNPRVHFQHYADRMNEPRRDQRRWRAWACWAITRRLRSDLPADPRHAVIEPTESLIADQLARHGLPREAEQWQDVLAALETLAAAARNVTGHHDPVPVRPAPPSEPTTQRPNPTSTAS